MPRPDVTGTMNVGRPCFYTLRSRSSGDMSTHLGKVHKIRCDSGQDGHDRQVIDCEFINGSCKTSALEGSSIANNYPEC